ncbi:hypothetical protein SAMN04515672_4465 [Natronorubrum texcoconense]|uniref:Uncharacterized protein n=1 Tax=Natronorubrum texcoconense TaxID=1095776 RepID=A0A1G9GDX6_9EURY|nr:hypothetical protein SAMN04515672_4465 [Natronorubrum texcoconense]
MDDLPDGAGLWEETDAAQRARAARNAMKRQIGDR